MTYVFNCGCGSHFLEGSQFRPPKGRLGPLTSAGADPKSLGENGRVWCPSIPPVSKTNNFATDLSEDRGHPQNKPVEGIHQVARYYQGSKRVRHREIRGLNVGERQHGNELGGLCLHFLWFCWSDIFHHLAWPAYHSIRRTLRVSLSSRQIRDMVSPLALCGYFAMKLLTTWNILMF